MSVTDILFRAQERHKPPCEEELAFGVTESFFGASVLLMQMSHSATPRNWEIPVPPTSLEAQKLCLKTVYGGSPTHAGANCQGSYP